MRLKFVYFMKLFLIISLSALLLASVGIMFETPLLFLAVAAVCTVSIRLLWKSALKSEKALQSPCESLHEKRREEIPSNWKQAA